MRGVLKDTNYLVGGYGGKKKARSRAGVRANARRCSCDLCAFTLQVGKTEVAMVLRVDEERGYIDLSKKHVTAEDATRAEERHTKTRAVHGILTRVAATCGVSLLTLYEVFGWDLYRRFEHAHDALRLVAAVPPVVSQQEDAAVLPEVLQPYMEKSAKMLLPPRVFTELIKLSRRIFVSKPALLRATLELTCFEFDGIEAIRSALQAAEAMSVVGAMDIVAKLVAPPTYVLVMNTTASAAVTNEAAIAHLTAACVRAQDTLTSRKGECIIKEAARIVNATDDHVFASLMATLVAQKQAVVPDDEEEEEEEEKEDHA
jgi:translation initiation factor 2 subunit 1